MAPITDPEATNAVERIEHYYADHRDPQLPAREDIHTDVLAYGRQYLRYVRNRDRGMPHEPAIQEVEAYLLEVWGKAPEPPDPSPPGPHPSPLVGVLRLEGLVFKDDTGPVLPRACHFGEALSAYTRKPLEVAAQLDAIAAAGYQAIRVWDVLGYYGLGWGGKEVTPIAFVNKEGQPVAATPDYYGQLDSFLRTCHARGLKVMQDRGDLNAFTDSQKYEHLHRVGQVYRSDIGRQVIAGIWAVNEATFNGVHEPRIAQRMIDKFKDGAGWWPDVRGLSDYDQTEEPTMLGDWSVSPATVITCHPLRDVRNAKRMLEHYFSTPYGARNRVGAWSAYTPKAVWFTEPTGPGERVTNGSTDNVELLCALAQLGTLAGGLYTYMSSHGVFWDGPIESQAGFYEVPKAMASLPQDIHTYDVVMHSGDRPGNPRPLKANDAVESRFDFALNRGTGQFVGMAYAKHGAVPMLALRSFDAIVEHPATQQVEWQGRVTSGQMLPLSGEIARLVKGRLV